MIDKIIANSKSLLKKMNSGCRYTYYELLDICGLTETDLCYAILYLLRDGKMVQYRMQEVYYETNHTGQQD